MSKKKRMGQSTGPSKGERKTVSLINRVHKDERLGYQYDSAIRKIKAYSKGKRTVVKVPSATNPHILEKLDANQVWGDWRGRDFEKKRKQ
jgi:hypothetical protein